MVCGGVSTLKPAPRTQVVGILEPEAIGSRVTKALPKSTSAKESQALEKEPQGRGFPVTRDSWATVTGIVGSLSTGTRIVFATSD